MALTEHTRTGEILYTKGANTAREAIELLDGDVDSLITDVNAVGVKENANTVARATNEATLTDHETRISDNETQLGTYVAAGQELLRAYFLL